MAHAGTGLAGSATVRDWVIGEIGLISSAVIVISRPWHGANDSRQYESESRFVSGRSASRRGCMARIFAVTWLARL